MSALGRKPAFAFGRNIFPTRPQLWSTAWMNQPSQIASAPLGVHRLKVTKKLHDRVTLVNLRAWFALIAAVLLAAAAAAEPILLRPARVFDGAAVHPGWSVLVDGDRIAAAGPNLAAPSGATVVDL